MKDNVRSGIPLSLMQQSICGKMINIHEILLNVTYLINMLTTPHNECHVPHKITSPWLEAEAKAHTKYHIFYGSKDL
jgi:hypothetical protein